MALSEDLMSKCSEHLIAYKSACEEHPHLKSFDSTLQQRTKKVIDSLPVTDEAKTESLYEVHKEVSQHLLEVTEGVAKFITEGDYDVWESEAVKHLVDAYFESTRETLKIFNTIEKCVEEAKMGQLLIRLAVADFERESAAKDVGGKRKKYEKTLKDLKEFKANGDPFDGKVITTQFELLKKQQESLIEEVCEAKKKIQDEIHNLEQQILIAHVVFGAAVALATVGSIILIATGVGAVLVPGLMALAGQLLAAGWAVVYTSLNRKKDALEKQLKGLQDIDGIEKSLEKGKKTNEEAMETVSTQVEGLEDRIQNMLKLADIAIENEDDEDDTKLVLKAISGNVEKLTEKIKEVGESVESHSKLISEARLRVLQKINRLGKH